MSRPRQNYPSSTCRSVVLVLVVLVPPIQYWMLVFILHFPCFYCCCYHSSRCLLLPSPALRVIVVVVVASDPVLYSFDFRFRSGSSSPFSLADRRSFFTNASCVIKHAPMLRTTLGEYPREGIEFSTSYPFAGGHPPDRIQSIQASSTNTPAVLSYSSSFDAEEDDDDDD